MDVIREVFRRRSRRSVPEFLVDVFGERAGDVLKKRYPIVLYGAGSAGKELLPVFRLCGVEPLCFCDSYASKDITSFQGLPLVSIDTMLATYRSPFIVITSGKFWKEIYSTLVGHGVENAHIFVLSPERMFFYTHFDSQHYSDAYLAQNRKKIQHVYNMLADEFSRNLFIDRIQLQSGLPSYTEFEQFMEHYCDATAKNHIGTPKGKTRLTHEDFCASQFFYFQNDVISFEMEEFYVDCGAYHGETYYLMKNAAESMGSHVHTGYLFEPDPFNYQKLRANTDNLSTVKTYNMAVWSRFEKIGFITSDRLEFPDSSAVSRGEKRCTVQAVPLDSILQNNKVTFIKMDVEGAEMEALKGAVRIISKNRPKLAICVYHKKEDLIEIPLLVKKLFPEYKIYLRHYSKCFLDTILFAVP